MSSHIHELWAELDLPELYPEPDPARVRARVDAALDGERAPRPRPNETGRKKRIRAALLLAAVLALTAGSALAAYRALLAGEPGALDRPPEGLELHQVTLPPAEELEYHYNIALEWVPEGYELEGGIEGGSDLVSYLSPVDGLLEVSVTPYSQSSVYNLNTEGCTKREITVQGHPAELYVTGEEMLQKRFSMTGFDIWSDMMIYWIDENNRVIVQIDATNLTEEEMLRLAEGFHWGGGQ